MRVFGPAIKISTSVQVFLPFSLSLVPIETEARTLDLEVMRQVFYHSAATSDPVHVLIGLIFTDLIV